MSRRCPIHEEIDGQRRVYLQVPLKSQISRYDHRPRGKQKILRNTCGEGTAEHDAAAPVGVIRLLVVAGSQEQREAHGEVVVFVGHTFYLVLGFQDLLSLLDFFRILPEALFEHLQGVLEFRCASGIPGLFEQRTEFVLRIRIHLRYVVRRHQDHGTIRKYAESHRHLQDLRRQVDPAGTAHSVGDVALQVVRRKRHFGLTCTGCRYGILNGHMLQSDRLAAHSDAQSIISLQQSGPLLRPSLRCCIDSGIGIEIIGRGLADGEDIRVSAVGTDLDGRRKLRVTGLRHQHLERQVPRIHVYKTQIGLLIDHVLAGKINAPDVQFIRLGLLDDHGEVLAGAHVLVQDGHCAVSLCLDIHDPVELLGKIVKYRDSRRVSGCGYDALCNALPGVAEIGDGHQGIGDAHAILSPDEPAHRVLIYHEDPGAGVGVGPQDLQFIRFI